jgi:hypothetical protein
MLFNAQWKKIGVSVVAAPVLYKVTVEVSGEGRCFPMEPRVFFILESARPYLYNGLLILNIER